MDEIRIFSPATVANVACGFDIFGFALEVPGDEIFVRLNHHSSGVTIKCITGDHGRLPLNAAQNTAGISVIKFLEYLNSQQGIEIEVHKKMPLGSGMGSSAASAAGSVFAVNLLLGKPLDVQALIPFAMEGERVACGTAHADNVAPALLGGFTLIRSYSPLDVIPIPYSLDLYCTLLHPKIEIHTESARKILKTDVSLSQHVTQSGNAAGLIVGLMKGDSSLIQRCLQDVIVEPVRSSLIPGFAEIKNAAMNEGALGCSISGSGPSVFALSLTKKHANNIGEKMFKACRDAGIDGNLYISKINKEGPRILS